MLHHTLVRRAFRAVWILLTVITLSALPWMVVEFKRANYSVHYQAWFIAGIFVVLASTASIYEVAMHLEHYNRPRLQQRVVRILAMVPIYAGDAWLGLRFKEARFYLDPVRECYEALVIYSFYTYLVAYLEDEVGDVAAYFSTKAPTPHLWPLARCARPWAPGADFFWQTKRGVLAYVVARPLTSAWAVAAQARGAYCDGEFAAGCVYPYAAFVNNCAQLWALYCLVLLYRATAAELAPIRPLAKFVAIKAVIFFTFWQGVAIAVLARAGLLRPMDATTYDTDDVAAGLQNFLICAEMFAAALAHAHAFPPRDYVAAGAAPPPSGFLRNVRVMFDVRDVVDDVHGVVRGTVEEAHRDVRAAGRKARGAAAGLVRQPLALLESAAERAARPWRGGGSAASSAPGSERGGAGGEADAERLLLTPTRRGPESP